MYNIRTAGQIWPEEAFNLARYAQNFGIQLFSLLNTPIEWVKIMLLWPWVYKLKSLHAMKLKLGTSGIN